MKKSTRTPANAPESQFGRTLQQGEQLVGPGVVKRPRREQAEQTAAADKDLKYTPSDQVFRRR